MGVKKYRDISQMPDTNWYDKGSEELLRAIRETWDLARLTLAPRFPAGVYKHRSFEDAQSLEEEWELENFRAYRDRIEKEKQAMR